MLKRHDINVKGWKRPTDETLYAAKESVQTIFRAKLKHDDTMYALELASEIIRQILAQEHAEEERLNIELDQ